MAPIQQQINKSSSYLDSSINAASSASMTASSKEQSSTKSISSSISNSSSNSNMACDSSNSNMACDSSNSRRASLEGRMSTMEWPQLPDFFLPIVTRGLFYNDSFFEDARKNFDQAVKEVVDQWGQMSHQIDDLTSYRNLREFDLQDTNQAVSVSQDETNHKVVMDVRDFMHNDLKVKIVDENELVVEGKVEKKDGGSVSTKTFQRRFVFPGLVNSEAVLSSMSSDGVLIITIPKNLQKQNPAHTIHSITKENAKATTASQNVSRVESKQETSKQSLQHQDIFKGSSVHSHYLDHHCSENLMKNLNTENLLSLSDMRSDFHDDFFAKSHHEFENAAKRVFSHCDKSTSSTDEMNLFKNLREKVSEEDNQSNERVSPNSHQPHYQPMKVTSGSTTNNYNQSSPSKHVTVTPF